MFACIFFKEDTSLSVVGKNDRDLKFDTFLVRENVEMKWLIRPGTPKMLYHGVIIKTGDDEPLLKKYAVNAYNVVIKPKLAEGMKVVEPPEELFTHEMKGSGGTKRVRVKTGKLMESEEQDKQLSPKKKKKAPQVHVHEDITNEKQNAPSPKKKKSDSQIGQAKTKNTSHLVGLQILSRLENTSLSQQFVVDEAIEDKELDSGGKVLPDLESSIQDITKTNKVDDEKTSTCSNTLSNTHLTDTWGLCQEAIAASRHTPSKGLPAPSSLRNSNGSLMPVITDNVLRTLKGLIQPDFMEFVKQLINSHETVDQPIQGHFPDKNEYTTLSNRPVQPQFYQHSNYAAGSLEQLSQSQQPTATIQAPDFRPTNEFVPHMESSWITEQTSLNSISFDNENFHSTINMTADQSFKDVPPSNNHESCLQEKQLRRSPRKQKQDSNLILNDELQVKLLDSSNIFVNKDGLRKAISAAKKSPKSGYILCYKLLALIFTLSELANSRGQGIGKKVKEGDTRPALDKTKISALKDYVVVWCKKNQISVPTEQVLNDAITERISYARKQMKNANKKT